MEENEEVEWDKAEGSDVMCMCKLKGELLGCASSPG